MTLYKALRLLLEDNGVPAIRRHSIPERQFVVYRVNYAGVPIEPTVCIEENDDTYPAIITESDILATDWEVVYGDNGIQ